MTLLFFLCFVGDFFVVVRRSNAHIRQVCCAFRSSHASKSPHKTAKSLSSSSKNPHLRRVNCGFSPRVSTKFPPQNNKKVLGVGVSLLFARQMLTYTEYATVFFTLPTFLKLTNTVDLFFLFRPKRLVLSFFSGVVCLCSLKCPHSRDRIGRHFRALAKTPALRPRKIRRTGVDAIHY